jgi:hypothetical protein
MCGRANWATESKSVCLQWSLDLDLDLGLGFGVLELLLGIRLVALLRYCVFVCTVSGASPSKEQGIAIHTL